MKKTVLGCVMICALFLSVALAADHLQVSSLKSTPIILSEGGSEISFDDFGFAPGIGKVLVPGERTGKLFLINPQTQTISSISDFPVAGQYQGSRRKGITSVDEGDGFIFVTNRSTRTVSVVDPNSGKTMASIALASGPDYVRYISLTHEVWVTEPHDGRIEVFTFSKEKTPLLQHSSFISVPDGPEALIVNPTTERAYTHLEKIGMTVAIDPKTKQIESKWPNGCTQSTGIALDPQKGFLFVGCAEGKVTSLDLKQNGKLISTAEVGSGVDIISYNSRLAHIYTPAGKDATLTILGVSKDGKISPLGTTPIEKDSKCITNDTVGNIWVCDPHHGQLLLFQDPYPQTEH